MQIRVVKNGKTEVIQLTDPRTRQRAATTAKKRDEKDGWPSQSRATQSRSEVPSKRDAKRQGRQKHPDIQWRGCGVGANTVRGPRAAAGDIRAIAAEETGLIVASRRVEARLREHMLPTTSPLWGTGMRFTDKKGAKSS